MPIRRCERAFLGLAATLMAGGAARAQERVIRVTNVDSQPVAYAFV